LGDVLRENRRSHPQKAALVCRDERYSYPEMDARVNRFADALLTEGVAHGDRVLWLGQNCHRVLEGLLAAAKIGAIFCPVNWRQTAEELAFVVDDVDARVVIWQDEEIGEAVRGARERSTSKGRWLRHDAGGDDSYEAFLASGAPEDPTLDIDPDDPLLMLYTAAFAGRPNGALLSHTAITTQDLVMGMLQEITSDYVYLNSGPLFHIATFMTTLATLHFGGTNVFTRRVDAEELCRIIQAERCTGAFILPPTMDQMVEVNRVGKYDLKSLRTYAGKPEWTEMITVDTSPWSRRPGGYGQTEVMGMLTLNSWGGQFAGTHGRPSPMVQVRVVDPDGNDVEPGETGEIVARGPTVMTGYWNRDDINTERRAGGWHHTNDLGRREHDGSITFIGPKTRIVKSAAENIYPAEVEACLQKHAAVKEAAIIGVPDPKWTQSVKAVVVLNDGHTATEDELIEHCRTHIASYKKPRSVEFVDRLPRKGWLIDYDALDERFGGGGYPGGRNRSA
jgi:acyl-CoA synthetase (AMP-forming)/AMP-acid ligase II